MKKSFSPPLMLGIAIAGISQSAHAVVLASEQFLTGSDPSAGEYTLGAVNGQDPTVDGFDAAWSEAGASVTATGLTYSDPNYLGASGGALEHTAAGRPFRAMDTSLASAFSGDGTVYLSFLAQFGTLGDNSAWSGYAAVEVGTDGSNDTGKTLAIGVQEGVVAGNFIYQVNNGTKTSLGITSDTDTHLFLVRFDMSTAAASDALTIWIDPDLSGGPGSDPSGGTTVSGQDLITIDNFRFGAGGVNDFVDEVRFGTTLADVGVVPEPSTALLGGFGLLALLRRKRQR